MKNTILLLAALLLGTGSSRAASAEHQAAFPAVPGQSHSFIFVEDGITFAVYPDGEFDFYIDNRLQVQAGIRLGNAAVTFNSGFNYNPFVQYDDFGAVIQVERVPVFYDFYGRVNRIGGIRIHYRNGLLYRLGGMRVFYNPMGFYDYHVGYINPFNRVYVYRPFHRFFIRPAAGFCMVYPRPYRRYYQPVRYTYYRPYRDNIRRAYARVGETYRYQPRSERSRIYRNDHRVVAREAARSRQEGISRTARHAGSRTAATPRSAQRSPAAREVATSGNRDYRPAPTRAERTPARQVARQGNRVEKGASPRITRGVERGQDQARRSQRSPSDSRVARSSAPSKRASVTGTSRSRASKAAPVKPARQRSTAAPARRSSRSN